MENSSTIKQKANEFTSQQQSVGISLQNFKQKFVFNLNSGPDAIFLDFNSPSPSQIIGMTRNQENQISFMMSEIIFRAGQILKLPISTTIVALNIAQYYFTRKTYLDYDFRDICMGSMFLACKSEETLRRSYQVASVFDYVFKMYEGSRGIKELELNSQEYNYTKQKVIKTENEILFELGFEVSKLFDIPHRYISGLINLFGKHKQCNQIAQHSWKFLNDIYRTRACIFYPGQTIASSAICMSFQKLSIPLSEKPWWILMESDLSQIKNICYLTNEMYQNTKNNQINLNLISEILQNIGKRSLNVSNVFPVPYHRKISLQNQGLLMKFAEKPMHKVEAQKKDIKKQKKDQSDSQIADEQKGSNQRNKKEKNKHKKKHKNHKYENRSRSHSRQKNQKKGKFQNDQQTPKINKQHTNKSNDLRIVEEGLSQFQMIKEGIISSVSQKTILNAESAQNKQKQNNKLDEINPIKKTALLDAKSMLSKISLKIKNIEGKNEAVSTLNSKIAKQNEINVENNKIVQEKQICSQASQNQQSSDDQDELLAELIQIKKKNLQKKD